MRKVPYYFKQSIGVSNNIQVLEAAYAEPTRITEIRDSCYQIARAAMNKIGAKHGLYAVYKYNTSNELNEVDFYNPPILFKDTEEEEFQLKMEYISKSNPNCLILCAHRRDWLRFLNKEETSQPLTQIQGTCSEKLDSDTNVQLDVFTERLIKFKNEHRAPDGCPNTSDVRITKGNYLLRCMIFPKHEYIIYRLKLLSMNDNWDCSLETMSPDGGPWEELEEYCEEGLSTDEAQEWLENVLNFIS